MTASERWLGLAPSTILLTDEQRSAGNLAAIAAAHQAGFDGIGLFTMLSRTGGLTELTTDRQARRRARDELSATGIMPHYTEGYRLAPDTSDDALRRAIEAGAEMGAADAICMGWDSERGRLVERLAMLAGVCAEHGIHLSLEPMPFSYVRSLREALEVIGTTGRDDIAVLVDALHLSRAGESPADVGALDRRLLRFVHICDAPATPPPPEGLMTEAMDRCYPGDGGLPLRALLAALPPDLPISIECPIQGEVAVPGAERAQRAAEATRRLFS